MKNNALISFACVSAIFSNSLMAAVSAEEAKQLGGPTLTAWGAEKAGNKEGTIPPYTGERPKVPASYNPKEPGNMPDPYANEKPLFVITAQNMAQYADKLTEGQKALFQRYPNYRMDIYPTHRTAVHAQYVLDNTLKNATACKTANNGLRLEGCYGGFTFPIPKTGNEAVWSHMLSHPAYTWGGYQNTYLVDTSGKLVLQAKYLTYQVAPYLDPVKTGTVIPSESDYWKVRVDALGPARRYGEKFIIVNALDPINPGNRAWSYIAGQRRVKLAPDLAYDTPTPASGGGATMDEQRIFLGAQDRYDMKLMGKREVFMMYNNAKLTDYHVCPDEVSHIKNFINPDCVRWELHRAWVVQATLKSGFRHILPKRNLYFDEDTWSAGFSESWDAAGKVYRVDNTPMFVWYFQPTGQAAGDYTFTNDLQTGLLVSTGGVGFPGANYIPTPIKSVGFFFSPEAIAGEGIR